MTDNHTALAIRADPGAYVTTPEQQHRAALAVCGRFADDRAAAREVLEALGLLPYREAVPA